MGPPPSFLYQRQLRNCSIELKPYLARVASSITAFLGQPRGSWAERFHWPLIVVIRPRSLASLISLS